jgi:hypothetical protein
MSMTPTKITDRDAEFAALLGHKQTESTWKPTLFFIARFREESEQLALKQIRDEIQQARDLVSKMVLAKTEELARTGEPVNFSGSAFVHKQDDSVIWTMLYAGLAPVYGGGMDTTQKVAHGADAALREYKVRFGNG